MPYETSIDTATNTAVTVGATSTAVLATDLIKHFAVFTNDSDEVIYLGLGAAAVSNTGIRLTASGGQYIINGTNLFTGAVNAICASGSKVLCVTYY